MSRPGIKCVKNRSELIFIKDDDNQSSVKYDLANRRMYRKVLRGNKKGEFEEALDITRFFTGYHIDDIEWDNENYHLFVKKIRWNYPTCSSVGTFVRKLGENNHLEPFFAMGIICHYHYHDLDIKKFPKVLLKIIKKYNMAISRSLAKAVIHNKDDMLMLCQYVSNRPDMTEDEVHEIFKACLESNSSGWNYYYFNRDISRLVNEYNYNFTTLMDRAVEYKQKEAMKNSRFFQLLRDYASMQSKMSTKYKKYPSYLATIHDIVVANYNEFKIEYEQELFEQAVDSDLAWEGKDYSIFVPEKPDDIKDEAVQQHNCVAGYIDRILRGECQIIFLRHTDKPGVSRVTVEVRGDTIHQAKQGYNRMITDEQYEALAEYAKSNELQIRERGVL